MLWGYSKRIGTGEKAIAAVLLGLWAYALLAPGALGELGLSWAASLATFMCAISKLPQLYAIYAEVGTGSLSLATTLLETGLGVAKLG